MKTKILDTNALLDFPITDTLDAFQREGSEIKVIIPFKVLIELDSFKRGTNQINENARIAIRFLDELRAHGKLTNGVTYKDVFTIQVHVTKDDIEDLMASEKVDNSILRLANELKEANNDVEIITRDIHERILADILDVIAKDVDIDRVFGNELYTGITTIRMTDEQLQEWCKDPKNGGIIPAPTKLYPNQFVIMLDGMGVPHYGIYNQQTDSIVELKKTYTAWGVKPKKNKNGQVIIEQAMLMHLLLDPSIECVTVIGPSGTGKTFLTLACALEQTVAMFPALYDRIVVLRPMVGVDKDIGALPGDKDEKLEPWMAPIFDNLECLLSNYTPKDLPIDMSYNGNIKERIYTLMDMGKLELEAITYVRGRSMTRQFIIVDDCQNLTPQQIATIITRAGEGTKVVLLGDVSRQQIDNKKLTPFSNGLSYVVDRFKGIDPCVAHITLNEVVRSRLATLGVEYLS